MGKFSYQQHLEALISLGHKWYVLDFDWYSCKGMPILAMVSLLEEPLMECTEFSQEPLKKVQMMLY